MTISTEAVSVTYTADGATTVFPVANGGNPIAYFNKADIRVSLIDTDGVVHDQTEVTDYTITGEDGELNLTGNVTFNDPPTDQWTVVVYRQTDAVQSLDLTRGGVFDPESLEETFDKIILALQEDRARLDTAILVQPGFDVLDAQGHRIINVGDPVDDTDAVNKQYLDDLDVSNQVEEAEAARDAAIAAKDESVAAKDQSVAAKDQSEDARDAALTAQTNAETAATNAENSKDLADMYAIQAFNSAGTSQMYADQSQYYWSQISDFADGVISVTSHTIGTGTKTFVLSSDGYPVAVGGWVQIVDVNNPLANWMNGQVVSYSGTSLQVSVSRAQGSGTISEWSIQLSGPPGVQGDDGASGSGTGDVVGPASSVANGVALYSNTTGKLLKDGGVLHAVALSGQYSDLVGKPTLAPVATSGDYADLTGKPTLGTMADENEADYTKTSGFGDAAFKNTGTGSGQVAAGNHNHAGVYEPADATILKSANIGTTVQGYDADTLKADVSANLTAGFTTTDVDDGTPTNGSTYTPSPSTSNMRRITNNVAGFTFAAPSAANDFTMIVKVTNGASAGAITFTGFTRYFGDALNTTNARVFVFVIIKINSTITLQKIDTGLASS